MIKKVLNLRCCVISYSGIEKYLNEIERSYFTIPLKIAIVFVWCPYQEFEIIKKKVNGNALCWIRFDLLIWSFTWMFYSKESLEFKSKADTDFKTPIKFEEFANES